MLAKHLKKLSVSLFCLMASIANAEVLAVSKLSCKITEQVVLGSKEGKAQRFSEYEGAYSKGDTVNLVLELMKYADTYHLDVNLSSPGTPVFAIFADIDKNTRASDITGVSMHSGYIEPTVAHNSEMRLEKNEFSAWNSIGRIFLERYYKDDWSGVLSNFDFHFESPNVGTVTLDCRTDTKTTIGDLYDSVVDIYQSLNKD